MILQHKEIENSTILPASDPPLLEDSPSLSNVTNKRGTVIIIKENGQERQEFYLERVFQKPPTHGFYCPNCKACIQKVYIQKGEGEQTSAITQPVQPREPIRCSSCFSFLIPIGSWLFPGLVSNEDGALNDEGPGTIKVASQYEAPEPDQSQEVSKSVAKGTSESAVKIVDGSGKQILQNIDVADETNGRGLEGIPGNNNKSQDSSDQLSATSQGTLLEPKNVQAATRKKHFWSNWAVIGGTYEVSIPQKPQTGSPKTSDWKVISSVSQDTAPKRPEIDFADKKQPELVEVKVVGPSTGPGEEPNPSNETDTTPLLTSREPPVPASSKTMEILKSVVYGGLTESLASLSVVTSAASADATTLNIVALAIANLIGGLFTLAHNLRELKADQPKRNDTDVPVDRYNELLGKRENFILHAFIAILSFIIFGLAPPVVYGFSFRESDEKDFKLAAVAGASILCITLLSIAKAYIKRPNSHLTYFQTVLYYVSTGAVASVLSYLAGGLVKKLVERLGWFEPASNFAMRIPGSSVQQPGWGSY